MTWFYLAALSCAAHGKPNTVTPNAVAEIKFIFYLSKKEEFF